MAITETIRESKGSTYHEQFWETVRYLHEASTRELTREEQQDLERAIVKIWVYNNILDALGSLHVEMAGIAYDLRVTLMDLHSICSEVNHHVDRPQSGARRCERAGYANSFRRLLTNP